MSYIISYKFLNFASDTGFLFGHNIGGLEIFCKIRLYLS